MSEQLVTLVIPTNMITSIDIPVARKTLIGRTRVQKEAAPSLGVHRKVGLTDPYPLLTNETATGMQGTINPIVTITTWTYLHLPAARIDLALNGNVIPEKITMMCRSHHNANCIIVQTNTTPEIIQTQDGVSRHYFVSDYYIQLEVATCNSAEC